MINDLEEQIQSIWENVATATTRYENSDKTEDEWIQHIQYQLNSGKSFEAIMVDVSAAAIVALESKISLS